MFGRPVGSYPPHWSRTPLVMRKAHATQQRDVYTACILYLDALLANTRNYDTLTMVEA